MSRHSQRKKRKKEQALKEQALKEQSLKEQSLKEYRQSRMDAICASEQPVTLALWAQFQYYLRGRGLVEAFIPHCRQFVDYTYLTPENLRVDSAAYRLVNEYDPETELVFAKPVVPGDSSFWMNTIYSLDDKEVNKPLV